MDVLYSMQTLALDTIIVFTRPRRSVPRDYLPQPPTDFFLVTMNSSQQHSHNTSSLFKGGEQCSWGVLGGIDRELMLDMLVHAGRVMWEEI